jgi:hypothetical protein
MMLSATLASPHPPLSLFCAMLPVSGAYFSFSSSPFWLSAFSAHEDFHSAVAVCTGCASSARFSAAPLLRLPLSTCTFIRRSKPARQFFPPPNLLHLSTLTFYVSPPLPPPLYSLFILSLLAILASFFPETIFYHLPASAPNFALFPLYFSFFLKKNVEVLYC